MYAPIGLTESLRKLPSYFRKQLPLGGCPLQGRWQGTVAAVEQLKQADNGAE